KAIKNHNLAKHLGKLDNNKQVIQLANQNLGYLHSARGDSEDAVHFYKEVAKDPNVDMNTKLPAIASLIKEYYNIEDYEQVKNMIEIGLELLKEMGGDDSFRIFYYIIYTYKYALNKENKKFENIVSKEFIPYLKKHNDYANIAEYTTMLAKHHESKHLYKDAAYNYELANQAYKRLITI